MKLTVYNTDTTAEDNAGLVEIEEYKYIQNNTDVECNRHKHQHPQ